MQTRICNTARTGRSLTKEALEHIFTQAAQYADVREELRCSPHTARHYYAQANLRNGLDVYSLSCLLGHENSNITKRYLQSLQDSSIVEMAIKTSPLRNKRLCSIISKKPRNYLGFSSFILGCFNRLFTGQFGSRLPLGVSEILAIIGSFIHPMAFWRSPQIKALTHSPLSRAKAWSSASWIVSHVPQLRMFLRSLNMPFQHSVLNQKMSS